MMIAGFGQDRVAALPAVQLPGTVQAVAVSAADLQNRRYALKAANLIYDTVAKIVPPAPFQAGRPTYIAKRDMLLQGVLSQMHPALFGRYRTAAAVPTAVPRTVVGEDARARFVATAALVKALASLTGEEIAGLAAGRAPVTAAQAGAWYRPPFSGPFGFGACIACARRNDLSGGEGLGVWGWSYVKDAAKWGTIAGILGGPAGAMLGAVLGAAAPEVLEAAAKKIKDLLAKIAETYCEYWNTGVPAMAARAGATAKGGPQGAQAAEAGIALVDQMCGKTPAAPTAGPLALVSRWHKSKKSWSVYQVQAFAGLSGFGLVGVEELGQDAVTPPAPGLKVADVPGTEAVPPENTTPQGTEDYPAWRKWWFWTAIGGTLAAGGAAWWLLKR